MRSTEEIKQKIETVNSSIHELQKRRLGIDEELNDIKKDLASNLGNPETEQRIASLSSNRDVVDEVISEKESDRDKLKEELAKAEIQEKKDAQFQKLVELAEQADESNKAYCKLFEDLDQELLDKLFEIAKARNAWRQASRQFINLAEQLQPAVKIRRHNEDNRSELEAASKEFIEQIASETDGSIEAVLTEIYVNDKFYRISRRNGRNLKPNTEHFAWAINEMLSKAQKLLDKETEKATV